MALAVRAILTVLMVISSVQASLFHHSDQAQASAETAKAARINNHLSAQPWKAVAALLVMVNPAAAFETAVPRARNISTRKVRAAAWQLSMGAGSFPPVTGNMNRRDPRMTVESMSIKPTDVSDQSGVKDLLKSKVGRKKITMKKSESKKWISKFHSRPPRSPKE